MEDEPAKALELEANGGKVKTRQPKSQLCFKLKVVLAVLLAVILLIVVISLVLVFASGDKVKPVFTSCPDPVRVTVHSMSDAVNVSASWAEPTATDNSGIVSIKSSHQPGTLFPRGSTTKVTYRAEDQSGNAALCAFGVTIEDCKEDEWRCDNGTCILNELVCDGVPACADMSDETLCEDCRGDDFLSLCEDDTKCIPSSYVCDGVEHCDDFADERYCSDCEENGFLSCQYSRQCYRRSDACNNVIDCRGFTDEMNCYNCASVNMDECSAELPYNVTFYPSVLNTEEEAIDYYMNFDDIMDCHADLQYFLCAYLFPECGKDRTPRYVCRNFCQEVQAACGVRYQTLHGQPLDLHCQRYPEATDAVTDVKLCRTSFTGCEIDGPTRVDLTDGKPYMLYSPNYPNKYPNAFTCTWFFQASEGKYVRFETIDLLLAEDWLVFGIGEEANTYEREYFFSDEVLYGKWLSNLTMPSDLAWVKLSVVGGEVSRGFQIEVVQAEAENVTCRDDQFYCKVIGCIDGSRLCDGYGDCYDLSDELHCGDGACPSYDMLKCGDGSCIHRASVCDGWPDCDDDEENCTFECDGGGVWLNDRLVCDGFNDCGDNSDEPQDCACVEERQFDCGERCIPNNYICDGMNDCVDESDEVNCTCNNWKNKCDDGMCLPFWLFCDNTEDCSDGSDEKDCPPCPGNYFQCDNLECVTGDSECDGYYDCADRSDEKNCESVAMECHMDSFTCGSGKLCIPKSGICDGVDNCPDGEDEVDCDGGMKPQGQACGERYINITSEMANYTLAYPTILGIPATCMWLVTGPPNTKITLQQTETIPCCGYFTVGSGHDPKDAAALLEIHRPPKYKGLVAEGNTMYVTFVTELSFLKFELLFKAMESVCEEGQKQCLSKYDECITAAKWCNYEDDCDTGRDEQECLRLETSGSQSTDWVRAGHVKVTIEGDEKYLCYDNATWSEFLGDAICNEYGFGFMNESTFDDVSSFGPITSGYYVLPEGELQALLNLGPRPHLYEVVVHSESCPSGKMIHLSCNDPECGRQGHMPRIISGRNALPGEVPWMVSISRSTDKASFHTCGGALITSKWVITAGHCVKGSTQPKVLLGTTNLTSEDGFVQTRQVKRAIPFPTYSNYRLNDIALLELEVPVSISDRVSPVCLPPRNDSHLTEKGSSATLSGWGGTIPISSSPMLLQTARATIVDNADCTKFDDPVYVNENVICCMNKFGEQNSCDGDSGGPLYVAHEGKWFQIGLVSRGNLPSCSAPGQAIFYTRLSRFLDFIERYVDV